MELPVDAQGHRREGMEKEARKAREKPHSPDGFLQDVGQSIWEHSLTDRVFTGLVSKWSS